MEKTENKPKSDGDIHVMPNFGRAHVESSECWCRPEALQDTYDATVYVCVVWVHNLEN